MAILLSMPFQGPQSGKFLSKSPITTPDLDRKWAYLGLSRRGDSTRMPVISGGTSRHDSTLTISAKLPERSLADTWKEIHGQNNWERMLDPMDPLLRSELIRYGEMAQACYDAFDWNAKSKYCGSCKVDPSKFFSRYLGWTHYEYEVTRYLHASHNTKLQFFFKKSLRSDGWSPAANWIGYVAVSDDKTSAHLGRRDIAICWRGTITGADWVADFKDILRSVALHKLPSPDPKIKAESGFLHVYTDKNTNCQYCKYSAREQVLAEVKRLVQKYADEELSITITGHSLGSALAILNAYDIAAIGVNVMDNRQRVVPICVYSFSGPRVGNARFKEQLERQRVKVLRVVNVHDKVPMAPGLVFNEKRSLMLQKLGRILPWCYFHVGVELALDHKNSPSLKKKSNLSCYHNLEALLHLLDGYRGTGEGERFVPTGGRDIALVNKRCDFLKDDLGIPPKWWDGIENGLLGPLEVS